MSPWVGPHAPSFGRRLWGCPAVWSISHHKGYCSRESTVRPPHPCGLNCGAPLLQATPSWTVYRLACQRLLPWLRVTLVMVSDAASPGSDQRPWGTAPAAGPVGRLGRPSEPDPWGLACCCSSLGCPWCGRVCGVLGHLAPVHRCAPSVLCAVCAVSWATWLLFTCLPAWCVVLRVRCPRPLGSCSPACPLIVLRRMCGVLGHLAPVHRSVGSVFSVVCAVSSAACLLFTCEPAR